MYYLISYTSFISNLFSNSGMLYSGGDNMGSLTDSFKNELSKLDIDTLEIITDSILEIKSLDDIKKPHSAKRRNEVFNLHSTKTSTRL